MNLLISKPQEIQLKTSMSNVKVKSSLKEQACDPPTRSLLYFSYFWIFRIEWRLNMHSCQTQIDIKLLE